MAKRLAIALMAFSLTAALFVGCGDGDTGPGTIDGIQGTVTYKDGTTPVAGATVTATSTVMEATFTTTSGSDGSFKFSSVPDDDYTVTAVKGAFRAQGNITVSDGKTTAAMTLALDIDESKVGVVPGSYDDIGAILTDLGYGFTTLTDANLADSSNLDPIELLFLNCGSDTSWAADATVQANLKNYVNDGGYLYASDWDYLYVEYCWPSAIDFYGDDLVGPYIGNAPQTITADVVNSGLAGYLGKDEASIYFDLPAWIVIDNVATSTDILVSGDFNTYVGNLNDKPLMVSFEHGSGIVAYTCFHNEAQITDDARKLLLYFISLTPS
ncbi:MAG: carboxypeptidase regulatory-like domain-containing protein [Candidatus Coatesbacteria bacterium]|nr:MAG: carboxypeptidase regulatory-like domain-containing protein [Candidatus Coatesbacteria bacterium]